ncbi:MAG: hypothetical protein ACRCV9_16290 [Burkholderiaceae bacterium]
MPAEKPPKAKQSTILADRLYVRAGVRTTAITYKHADGRSEQLASAPTRLPERVAQAKAQALQQWAKMRGLEDGQPNANNTCGLFEDYFAWQAALPDTSTLKKAKTTLATNAREQKPLLAYFGHMLPSAITRAMVYQYSDIRAEQGAPAGVVKEIALASAVFSFGQRRDRVGNNPFQGLRLEKTSPETRRVIWPEIEFLTKVGRARGGTSHIQALAARAAWLAFKRPGEVLKLSRNQITDAGIEFHAIKRRKTQGALTITIEWSRTLRATIDEALSLRRWAEFGGSRAVFGNMAGHPYTKSGWGTQWKKLMDACEAQAAKEGVAFERFTLRHCRPGGVSEKRQNGEDDVYDGSGHTTRKMIDQAYDRRRTRSSTPAK